MYLLWDQNKKQMRGELFVQKGPWFHEIYFSISSNLMTSKYSWNFEEILSLLSKMISISKKKVFKWYLIPSPQSLGTAWEPLNVFDLFPKEVSKQLFKLLQFPGTMEALDCQILECFKRRSLPSWKERSNTSASLPLSRAASCGFLSGHAYTNILDRTTHFLSPSAFWKYSRYSSLSLEIVLKSLNTKTFLIWILT